MTLYDVPEVKTIIVARFCFEVSQMSVIDADTVDNADTVVDVSDTADTMNQEIEQIGNKDSDIAFRAHILRTPPVGRGVGLTTRPVIIRSLTEWRQFLAASQDKWRWKEDVVEGLKKCYNGSYFKNCTVITGAVSVSQGSVQPVVCDVLRTKDQLFIRFDLIHSHQIGTTELDCSHQVSNSVLIYPHQVSTIDLDDPHQVGVTELDRPRQVGTTDMMSWHYFIEVNAADTENKTVVSNIEPKGPGSGSFHRRNRISRLV